MSDLYMTPQRHYEEAERLLAHVCSESWDHLPIIEPGTHVRNYLLAAQVHATLATSVRANDV